MCCNRPRPTITNTGTTRRAVRSVTPQAGASAPAPAQAQARLSLPTPIFEYVGDTALTVVSPITRKTYRFEKTGVRLIVDIRDRSWVAFVPNLVRVA
jgi:hypothetical protein